MESMTKQEAREVVDFINKAVDASILRNLVRSPNKDMVGNQRGKKAWAVNQVQLSLTVILDVSSICSVNSDNVCSHFHYFCSTKEKALSLSYLFVLTFHVY